MDIFDVMIMASLGVLVVIFASVAMLESWDARAKRHADPRADAQVIQHPQSDRRVNRAA